MHVVIPHCYCLIFLNTIITYMHVAHIFNFDYMFSKWNFHFTRKLVYKQISGYCWRSAATVAADSLQILNAKSDFCRGAFEFSVRFLKWSLYFWAGFFHLLNCSIVELLQARMGGVQSCLVILRVFRELRQRDLTWKAVTDWVCCMLCLIHTHTRLMTLFRDYPCGPVPER